MSQEQPEYDTETALNRMQEQYREQTGKELPDHVLENYQEFFSLGPGPEEIQTAFERGRSASDAEYTKPELVAAVSATFVVALLLGLGIAFAVAESFGVAVSALVAAGVGFILGSVLIR